MVKSDDETSSAKMGLQFTRPRNVRFYSVKEKVGYITVGGMRR